MLLAQREAQRLNHDYLGTEHILLGLFGESGSGVARLFDTLHVDIAAARTEVEKHCVPGNAPAGWDKLPLTPSAKRALGFAAAEAESFHGAEAAPEHLLLGLLIEEENSAAGVLTELGLGLAELRQHIAKVAPSENRDRLVHGPEAKGVIVPDPSAEHLSGMMTASALPEHVAPVPVQRTKPEERIATPGTIIRQDRPSARLVGTSYASEFHAANRQLRVAQMVLACLLGTVTGAWIFHVPGALLGFVAGVTTVLLRNAYVAGGFGGAAGFIVGFCINMPKEAKSGLVWLLCFIGAMLGILCFGPWRIFLGGTHPRTPPRPGEPRNNS
jgi:ATP-dependent Clp protease ATP-binding subunit ClpC